MAPESQKKKAAGKKKRDADDELAIVLVKAKRGTVPMRVGRGNPSWHPQ